MCTCICNTGKQYIIAIIIKMDQVSFSLIDNYHRQLCIILGVPDLSIEKLCSRGCNAQIQRHLDILAYDMCGQSEL